MHILNKMLILAMMVFFSSVSFASPIETFGSYNYITNLYPKWLNNSNITSDVWQIQSIPSLNNIRVINVYDANYAPTPSPTSRYNTFIYSNVSNDPLWNVSRPSNITWVVYPYGSAGYPWFQNETTGTAKVPSFYWMLSENGDSGYMAVLNSLAGAIQVKVYRVPFNMTCNADLNNGFAQCNGRNASNIIYTFNTGLTKSQFNNSQFAFSVIMDATSMSFYINGFYQFSVNDDSFQYGGIGIGAVAQSTTSGYFQEYIKEIRVNEAVNVVSTGGNYSLLSYPDFNATKMLNFYELTTDSKTNWIALNEYVYPQWSVNTPAGILNSLTQTTCPIFDLSTGTLPGGLTYSPKVPMYMALTSNTPSCVYRVMQIANAWSYTYHDVIPGLVSWGDFLKWTNLTEWEYQVPQGGWGSLTTFIHGDNTTNKYGLVGSSFACSSPSNITLAFQFQDINSCSGGGTKVLYYVLKNIGINPYDNSSCDIQLANGSCYYGPGGNGTSPDKGLGSGGNPSIVNTGQTPAEKAGITDVFGSDFNLDQIFSAFYNPAFIALIGCLVLAGSLGYYAGPMLGVVGFIGAFVVLTGFGMFPLWIGISVIVLTAIATAFLMKIIL